MNVAEIWLSENPKAYTARSDLTDRAVGYFRSFHKQDPNNVDLQWQLSRVLRRRANLTNAVQQLPEAEKIYAEAVELAEESYSQEPSTEKTAELAMLLADFSASLREQDRFGQALIKANQAKSLVEQLDSPNDDGKATAMLSLAAATAEMTIAEIDLSCGRFESARDQSHAAWANLENLLAKDFTANVHLALLLKVSLTLAEAHECLNEPKNGIRVLMEVTKLADKHSEKYEGLQTIFTSAAVTTSLARLRLVLDPTDPNAQKELSKVIPKLKKLADEFPHYTFYTSFLTRALSERAYYRVAVDLKNEALSDVNQAIQRIWPLVQENQLTDHKLSLARALEVRSIIWNSKGNFQEAIADLKESRNQVLSLCKSPNAAYQRILRRIESRLSELIRNADSN